MVFEGISLYKKFNKIAGNVVIKNPINPAFGKEDNFFDCLKTVKILSDKNIPVNVTLIFTPEQALLAARAGAKYVSPFAGRIDDFLREKRKKYDSGIASGVDLVAQCVTIFREHKITAKVLAASIRNKRQLREVALVGADIATIPFAVLQESLKHEKTAEGVKKFSEDMPDSYRKLLTEK